MLDVGRVLMVAYALSICLGGYLAVSGLRGLWTEAARFQELASLSAQVGGEFTVLEFDRIEPAAGAQ